MGAESMRLRAVSAEVDLSLRKAVLAFVLVCIVLFPLVLGLGMTRGLNHDEHQHIAAGALVAREGLIPYRDFPHFHTPYLPFVYAALFRVSDQLLTSARLFSTICSTAILGIIGGFAYALFVNRGKAFASLVGIGAVVLALTTTLFTQTAGRAWNHEPSLLLVLVAFVAHIAGLKTGRWSLLVVSGILLGFAIGTRITCAPLIAPFGLATFLFPLPAGWHWKRAFAFSGGLLAGLAGLIHLFATVPEQALFDNFGFAEANIVYRYSEGEPRTMTLPTKLRFLFKEIVRPDFALFVAGIFPVVMAFVIKRRSGFRLPLEIPLLLLLLPFVLMGSLAPSPAFDQYFFPLVPWLLILGLFGFASIPPAHNWSRRLVVVGALAVAVSAIKGVKAFHDIDDYFQIRKWEGTRLHRGAEEIRSHVTTGRILTLAPAYPLEAGLSIYPSFSPGPFAWRVSPYINPAKAARIGVVSPATLNEMLLKSPPAAVLLGFEKEGEDELKTYARRTGLQKLRLEEDEHQLWVPVRK